MDLRGLDLNLLIVLDAMFDERSTVAAARRLGTSQPTISSSLAKLRVFFNDELFVRQGQLMEPTPFANGLKSSVGRIIGLARSELLFEGVFEPTSAKRTFNLSTSDVSELMFIPGLFKAIKIQAPHVSFTCLSKSPHDLKTMMTRGQIDLAIGYHSDLTDAGFYEQKLLDHPFACLVRADHPLIADTLSLDQFLGLDHIVVEPEGHSQELFERKMIELGLPRKIVLRLPHFMSVPLLLRDSDAIATVPLVVAESYSHLANLKILPVPIDAPVAVLKQFWHRSVHTDPGVVWLRRLIANIYMNHDPLAASRCGKS
jgi:DNA-binding transcriptional LysR family regulator